MRIYQKRKVENRAKLFVEKLLIDVFVIVGMIAVLNWSIGVFAEAAEFYIINKDGSEVSASVPVHSEEVEKSEQINNVAEGEGGDITSSPSASQELREVIATTYNAEVGQTDSDPFTMASGKRVYEGAVASNCYPKGTEIMLDGEKYVVEDRMNKRFTALCGTSEERVDVFKWDRKDNFKKNVKLEVL